MRQRRAGRQTRLCLFQDDPEVLRLHVCVCVVPYVFIWVSLYPQQGCVQREREKEGKKGGAQEEGRRAGGQDGCV